MRKLPPRSFVRFFRWYSDPKLVDHIEGDLFEEYNQRLKTKGKATADFRFIADVLLLFRPGIIRPIGNSRNANNYDMFKSYFTSSLRNIRRSKLFSAVNIVGLAASMSAGLLLITIVSEMMQYDQFHANKDNIYRVISRNEDINGNSFTLATTSVKASRIIKTDFTGVKDVTPVQHGLSGDYRAGDKTLPLKGYWTEPTFFNIFSFELIKGSQATALREPNSIVLSESAAQKFFGHTDVLGEQIVSANDTTQNYVVTGIMRDVPRFSHLQFEALGSFSTISSDQDQLEWGNVWSTYSYALLDDGTSSEHFTDQLTRLSENENLLSKESKVYLKSQPLTKIALGEQLENQAGPVMPLNLIWFLGGLSLIVLISACSNYTNLSIARSLKRSREIGIRKIVGARAFQVLGQFVTEGIIISLASLVIAVGAFFFIRPAFISLTPNLWRLLTLELTFPIVGLFVLFAIVTGFIAGLLPGLFYIKVKALTIVKKVSSIKLGGRFALRKVLLVTQYGFSLIFITTVVILYGQYRHFITTDLGFATDNILNIQLQDVKPEILSKNLNDLASVAEISKSFMITSVGYNYYTYVRYGSSQDSVQSWYNKVDDNYLSLFGFKFVAGENFSKRTEASPETEVIVNEKLLQKLNVNVEDAIGETLRIQDTDLRIVGVLADFHHNTLQGQIKPFIFRNVAGDFRFVNVKLTGNDLPATMLEIEDAWRKSGTSYPLNAQFYDDMIERAYNEYSSMIKVIGYMAALAVMIASLGLVGMVVYSTEARLAEVSIRKVFGARIRQLVFTLGKGFIVLLIVAGIIAIPATWFFFETVVLPDITYHAAIGVFELTIGYAVVLAISLVVIGLQTLKIAVANPVDTLRSE